MIDCYDLHLVGVVGAGGLVHGYDRIEVSPFVRIVEPLSEAVGSAGLSYVDLAVPAGERRDLPLDGGLDLAGVSPGNVALLHCIPHSCTATIRKDMRGLKTGSNLVNLTSMQWCSPQLDRED